MADTKGQVGYLGIYRTPGRYDTVILFEAPNDKIAMKMGMRRAEDMDIETFLAIPREDAKKFVE